jgi:hypothetical protein
MAIARERADVNVNQPYGVSLDCQPPLAVLVLET